jgi:hypothetical protein
MSNGTPAILSGAPITATGGLLFADPGTPLPDDATAPIDSAFVKGGYVGEDGVTRTTDASDDKVRAWGGDAVKIIRTEHSITYKFQFLEAANAEVLKLINGPENVTISGSKITVKQTKKIPPRKSYILDMKDDPASLREVIPIGQLTTSGDVTFVHSDVIRYEVSIECFPDDAGVKALSHMDTGEGPIVPVDAVAKAIRSTNTVTAVAVTAGGTDYAAAPTVVFSGGGGTGAAATAFVENGRVVAVDVTAPGSGYTSTPTVKFTRA